MCAFSIGIRVGLLLVHWVFNGVDQGRWVSNSKCQVPWVWWFQTLSSWVSYISEKEKEKLDSYLIGWWTLVWKWFWRIWSSLISLTTKKKLIDEGCFNKWKKSVLTNDHQKILPVTIPVNVDLVKKWEEDQIALKQLSERIQVLMKDNHRYPSSIVTLKT